MKRNVEEMFILTHEAIKFKVVETDYANNVIVREVEDGFEYCNAYSPRKFAEILAEDDEGYEMIKKAVEHFNGKGGIFTINVSELFTKDVEVEAANYDEAVEKVRKMYDENKIMLDFHAYSIS